MDRWRKCMKSRQIIKLGNWKAWYELGSAVGRGQAELAQILNVCSRVNETAWWKWTGQQRNHGWLSRCEVIMTWTGGILQSNTWNAVGKQFGWTPTWFPWWWDKTEAKAQLMKLAANTVVLIQLRLCWTPKDSKKCVWRGVCFSVHSALVCSSAGFADGDWDNQENNEQSKARDSVPSNPCYLWII